MKRFALIGHPVAGSLSPALFAAAYGGRYPYDLLDFQRFEDAWQAFLDGYDGINVTAPYKQDAYASVDWLSPEAQETGAVNLVVKTPSGLKGYNTDVDGVVGAVREAGLPLADALVLGTGGAARAAVAAARRLGCSVTVAGRSLERAAALGCPAVSLSDTSGFCPDLVISTIPGEAMSSSILPGLPGNLFRNAVVLEAEYKQPALAQVSCRQYIHGRRWLLHQAIAGYSLFTGEPPSVQEMLRAL
ncbi:MAG: hypothetical protein J5669_06495 [Bacteroidales bacterium]|nr:hypothetical protein [Bacteroidales bacterium]